MHNLKNQYENIRLKYNNVTSAYAYNSIFLWEKAWGLQPVLFDDLFTVEIGDTGSTYFFPCGSKEEIHRFISKAIADDKNIRFKYMSIQDTNFLNYYFPRQFKIFRDEASDEYVYSIKEHMDLEGKKFSYCRGHLNHIINNHDLSIKKFDYSSQSDIDSAHIILKGWKDNHLNDNCLDSNYSQDSLSDYDAYNIDELVITYGADLSIETYLIYLDGRPFSIQAGYNIGNGTFDLCLTKEVSRVSGGSYAAKNILFKALSDRYEYINLEEDLGINGLKESKLILRPVCMNEMYEAQLI